jgi:uncharacterized protein
MTPSEILDFAKRFVASLEGDDPEQARAFYAPDAQIWHNTDNIVQSADENIKVLKWMMRTLPNRTYRVTRLEALSDGFLQQHVLEATLPDGTPWSLQTCVVIKITNGQISRLDEYMDSAQTSALVGIRR